MFITDAQIHIWEAESPDNPWPEWSWAFKQRQTPFEASTVIDEMDAAGVNRTVIVPPSWAGDSNEVALAAVRDYPGRFAVMGRINVREAHDLDFSTWRDQPGMLGIRMTFRPELPLTDIEWFWPKASNAGLPIMVYSPKMTAEIGDIARRYPDLRIIVDHLNLSVEATDNDIGPAVDRILPLSDNANLAVKLSALPLATDDDYPFASLTPHVRRVVDAFGAERCLWGSDLSRLFCPYSDWVNAMAEGLGCLATQEIEWIMGKSAETWLDWPVPS